MTPQVEVDLDYQTMWMPQHVTRTPHAESGLLQWSSPQHRSLPVCDEDDGLGAVDTVTPQPVFSLREPLSGHDELIYISSDDSSDAASDMSDASNDGSGSQTSQNSTSVANATQPVEDELFKADNAGASSEYRANCEDHKTAYRSASLPLPEYKRAHQSSRPFSCGPVMLRAPWRPPSLCEPRIPTPASMPTTSRCDSPSSVPSPWGECATPIMCTPQPDDEGIKNIRSRHFTQQCSDKLDESSVRWSTGEGKPTPEDGKTSPRRQLRSKRSIPSSPRRRTRRLKMEIPITAVHDTEYYPSSTDMDTEGDLDCQWSDEELPPRKRRRPGANPTRVESPSDEGARNESTDLDGAANTAARVTPHRQHRAAEATDAAFDEWTLQDVVLKRTFLDGRATFQLQFDWDMCFKHGVETSRKQREPSRHRRGPAAVAGRCARRIFTPEEDRWLVKLKEKRQLPWVEIHRRFCGKFTERSKESLQVRYSTKLKQRNDCY